MRRKNLEIVFNNSSIIPFKWRGSYLCFYCGKDFSAYAELRKHTKGHGPCSTKDYALRHVKGTINEVKIDVSDIVCEICNEPFNNYDEIVYHLKTKHGLEYDTSVEIMIQEYRLIDHCCLVCKEQFPFFRSLVTHMNKVHPKNSFICDDCGAIYNKKRDLKLHIRKSHRRGGYPCKLCSEVFETQNLLSKHQNAKHMFECHTCSAVFSSLVKYRKHKKYDHPDSGGKKCPHCSKMCHSNLGLKQHASKCKVNPVEDNYSMQNKEVVNKQPVNQIRQNIMSVLNMSTAVPFKFLNQFACFYCPRKFPGIDELKTHTIAEHPVCDLKCDSMMKCKGERRSVKIDITGLTCKECSATIPEFDDLVDHIIEKHEAKYDKTIKGCLQPFKISKGATPCPICPNQVFRYFSLLLKHINTVHTDNSIICSYCGQSFMKLANLRAHVSYNHTRVLKCTNCDATFKNSASLGRHKAKYHDFKDYKCTHCDESFTTSYMRQKHLIQAHDTGHKCSYCGRMFTRNSFMIDHIRRMHFREKNEQCSVCKERFFDKYLLRMHMVKHNGERKFHCGVCGKSFLRKSNLSGHMDVHRKQVHLQSLGRSPSRGHD